MAVAMKERYHSEVVPALMERFGYKNVMQVPRVEKVVINIGVGNAAQNPKSLDAAIEELAVIAGQRPQVRRARKSVSSFRVREGMPIGCRVTLRGDRMYHFLDRLFNVALPRVRDFRGISANAFDGRGNYTLGLREQLVFPEIDYDSIEQIRGMNITVVTTAKTDEEGRELLKQLGAPLREG